MFVSLVGFFGHIHSRQKCCGHSGNDATALSFGATREFLTCLHRSVFFFFLNLGLHLQHMEVLRLGVELDLQLRLTPQPGQIRATSATYTAAHGNPDP